MAASRIRFALLLIVQGAAFLGPLASFGCDRLGETPPTVRIGLVAPFSGRSRVEGYNVLYGVKLAIQEWNEKGGVAGYRVELVAYDDRNEGATAALQAKKLVIDPQMVGVVGHLNNLSAQAAAEVYHQGGLAVITLGATADGLRAYPEIFPLVASDTDIARQAAQFIKGKSQRVAIVSQAPDHGLATALRSALDRVGVRVVGQRLLPIEMTDFSEITAELSRAYPDLIFYSGSSVGGADLWAALSSVLPSSAFIYNSALYSSDFIKIVGAAAEGTYYISLVPHPSQWPAASAFRARYRSLTGAEPEPSAALAYDATHGLLSALERSLRQESKPNRAAVARALAQTLDYPSITGTITLAETGKNQNTKVYVYRITGLAYPGQLVYVGE